MLISEAPKNNYVIVSIDKNSFGMFLIINLVGPGT